MKLRSLPWSGSSFMVFGCFHEDWRGRLGAGIGAIAFRGLGAAAASGAAQSGAGVSGDDGGGSGERFCGRSIAILGCLLAEFCKMPDYTAATASRFIRYEGLENYLAARERGKGVLVLTGHLGAWELSSFYHSLMGMPMGMVIRRLDNPLVDAFVNRIRCLHGNRVIHKDDFARGLIASMRAGETVGILMDTNMTPPQGVFVPFFGVQACTASGMARIAAQDWRGGGAGVSAVGGERAEDMCCTLARSLEVVHTGDAEQDAVANTATFTAAIEGYIRRYPEQWLWMHRRWKTRPAGEEGIY